MIYHDLYSPVRPLDWRWQNALDGVPPDDLRPDIDPLSVQLADWMAEHGRDPAAWPDPDEPLAGLRDAALIHAGGGLRRDELEAWLLSGEDLTVIAQRMALAPVVPMAYFRFYYDFGTRRAKDRIRILVFPLQEWTQRPATEPEVWKYLAIAAGPYVFSIVLADFLGRPPVRPEGNPSPAQLRSLVYSYAEGFRRPVQTNEVLRFAHESLASMKARAVPPDAAVPQHLLILKLAGSQRRPAVEKDERKKTKSLFPSVATAAEATRSSTLQTEREVDREHR